MVDGPVDDRGLEPGSRRIWALVLAVVVAVSVVTGCGTSDDADDAADDAASVDDGAGDGGDGADGGDVDTQTNDGTDDDGEDGENEGDEGDDGGSASDAPVVVSSGNVPVLEDGQIVPADLDGPSAEVVTIQEDPYIGVAVYPRPDYEANPWSQWGQGIVLDDGRVITAIGDHLGADANSYLFVYDPETATLTRFADVLSALDHQPGSWGYGKIHSQMVDGGDGGIFFTTYYGSRRGLSFDGSYDGDTLFRLDKASLELQPVVVPVPDHGVPSLASNGAGLIYGEAVDPLLDEETYPEGGFFVFDVTTGEVTTFAEDPRHDVFRNVIVDRDGAAWYAAESDSLFRYDPAVGDIELTTVDLPGPLRASTTPTEDGTIYGVTSGDETFELFAFDPAGEVRPLGEALWYSTSLALLPDESGFLYVPGAHGDSWYDNSPLISVDTETGEQTTVVELLEPVRDALGLTLGGTYSVTVDHERNLAHIGFNAGPSTDEPWGEVVFVVVELP